MIYASSCVDEELWSARIGLPSVRHRQGPRWVAIIWYELVLRAGRPERDASEGTYKPYFDPLDLLDS